MSGAMFLSAAAMADGGPPADPPRWPSIPESAPSDSRTTIGYVETVIVYPADVRLRAKIDTGALSSSLDATDIQLFGKDGQDWVRFTVLGDREIRRRIELPVARTVRIRRADTPLQPRYVVQVGICLGSYYKMAEVNLINRDDLNYRMLIGRSFLQRSFVVDPAETFLARPNCEGR